ncbi:MAG TPA: bifunctional glutamate N-acetyltransferase/amino-acid acetyltransferase ArgJ [Aliidongia sp.]|nr:bifunctional glutamate N-acetyltransferase/amino-acid acetyltransferase ArgJ [Aliidongia sp.]
MTAAKSPLAPAGFPALEPIAGVRLGGFSCGIRYKGRDDLMIAVLDPGTTVSGVFTRSKTPGAPVDWCRKILPKGSARVLVVNSGNSNVFTGKAGRQLVEDTAKAAAHAAGCAADEVYISSTGVIGELPPADKILNALPDAVAGVSADGWNVAAGAIMTTDTFPKGSTRKAVIEGVAVTINGFCKGSGMIAPDMATMLGYVFTDAKLPAAVLQTLLTKGVDKSFNSTTVDGDTSTSDTVLLLATGAAKNAEIASADDPKLRDFRRKLDELLLDLALQIVRDGEGAEKLVEIRVTGAASRAAARRIGLTVGNSPLVKTALAAGDANWGRIVAAVGRSGEAVDRDRLSISAGGIRIAENGGAVPGYDEAPVAKHMAGREILIEIDIGLGRGKASVWTCDLTHRYIDINGSYRS